MAGRVEREESDDVGDTEEGLVGLQPEGEEGEVLLQEEEGGLLQEEEDGLLQEEEGGMLEEEEGGPQQEEEHEFLEEESMEGLEAPILPTTICLKEWVEKQHQYPTLTDLFPQGHNITLQIIDFTMAEGKPTGKVLLTDGEVTIPAVLGTEGSRRRKEYVDYMVQRRFGKNWLVKISETEGPPSNMSIVRYFLIPSRIYSTVYDLLTDPV